MQHRLGIADTISSQRAFTEITGDSYAPIFNVRLPGKPVDRRNKLRALGTNDPWESFWKTMN